MTAVGLDRLCDDAKGLRLFKHNREDELIGCQLIMFDGGSAAISTVLRRAAISGHVEVEPFSGEQDFFADVFTDEHTWKQTILLDRRSYRALKNRWMRCRIERE